MRGFFIWVFGIVAFYAFLGMCLALGQHSETGARMFAVPVVICALVSVSAAWKGQAR